MKCGCNFNGVQALNFIHGFRRLLLYSTSSSLPKHLNPYPSLANCLVEALGYSTQQSLSTSTKLSLLRKAAGLKNVSDDCKLVSNANLVINFFKQIGLDESQIRMVIQLDSRLLMSNVDKTLKPKIELLQEIGLTGSDLSRAISVSPKLLLIRLNPVIQTLRRVLGSDDNVGRVLGLPYFYRSTWNWSCHKNLISNVELLEKYGTPYDIIQKHIVQDPVVFFTKTQLFEDRLIRVEQKLGIPRDAANFLYGLRLLSHNNEKTLESKFQVYKSFGWAQSDILALVSTIPNCLAFSEATIKKKMGFFMSELGYQPAFLVSHCAFMTYSLEKRVVPRHHVLLVLKEKGLIKMNYSLYSAVKLNNSLFLNKFVLPFEEVHEVYAKHVWFSCKAANPRKTK